MKQDDFNKLPDKFAERINGRDRGYGVLQFGYKGGFNQAIELLAARVEHSLTCNKMQVEQWSEAQLALNDSPEGADKISAQEELNQKRYLCTCGLDVIMKGYPQNG